MPWKNFMFHFFNLITIAPPLPMPPYRFVAASDFYLTHNNSHGNFLGNYLFVRIFGILFDKRYIGFVF